MTPPVEDRLLDVAEAAKILCTSPDYLYRHWEKYPFAEKLSPKQLRFSYVGISLPDTFSTLRHMINSLNQMAFIFFPAEHDVQVGSLYTPP